jgi:hypothetical protein
VHRVLEADLYAAVLLLQGLALWSGVGVAGFERMAARKREGRLLRRTLVTATAFSLGLGVWAGAHAHERARIWPYNSSLAVQQAVTAPHPGDPGRTVIWQTR